MTQPASEHVPTDPDAASDPSPRSAACEGSEASSNLLDLLDELIHLPPEPRASRLRELDEVVNPADLRELRDCLGHRDTVRSRVNDGRARATDDPLSHSQTAAPADAIRLLEEG